MLNEYGIVLIEILIAFISGLMSIGFIRKRNDCILTWKEFGYRFITFLVLLVITFIYMIEYQSHRSIHILLGMFVGILLLSILVFFFFIFLGNFMISLFKERNHSWFHLILNFKDFLDSCTLNRLSQINNLVESCFIFTSTFTLGSMIVAFIFHFFLSKDNPTNIYLLEIGPLLILWFVVLALSFWILSLFVTLFYYERIKDEDVEINRIQLRKKIQENKNEM